MSYTSANVLLDIHASALAGMVSSPKHFARWAALAADEDYPDADLSEERFRESLVSADEAALTALWSRHLTAWDFAEEPQWALDTPPAPTNDGQSYTTGSGSAAIFGRRWTMPFPWQNSPAPR